MNVTSDIRRSDLFHLNLYVYPRSRGTYVMFGIIMLLVAVIGLIGSGDFTPSNVALNLFIGAVSGAVGVAVTFLICVLAQLALQSKNTGVLGMRTYALEDDGFGWDGEASSGKQKWTAVRSVIKTRNYVLISITPGLFFIVPGRSFPSGEVFQDFFDQAFTLWKKSHS